MTWTKLGESFFDEPALVALPRSVRLMHAEALVWCNRFGTDGRVPERMLNRITDEDAPDAAAAQLVAAGKWIKDGDGWLVDFADQPLAADVRRTQALAAERQRRQRQHRGGDHALCDTRYCTAASREMSRVTNGVSHDTRTDPYRTDPTVREERGGKGGARIDSAGAASTQHLQGERPGLTVVPNDPYANDCIHSEPGEGGLLLVDQELSCPTCSELAPGPWATGVIDEFYSQTSTKLIAKALDHIKTLDPAQYHWADDVATSLGPQIGLITEAMPRLRAYLYTVARGYTLFDNTLAQLESA